MDDAGVVQAGEPVEHSAEVVEGLVHRNRARGALHDVGFPDHLTEVVAVMLHEIVGDAIGFVEVPDGDDIGVSQACHRDRLGNEQPADFFSAHQVHQDGVRFQAFEGHDFLNCGDFNPVDAAHAAASQKTPDAVFPDAPHGGFSFTGRVLEPIPRQARGIRGLRSPEPIGMGFGEPGGLDFSHHPGDVVDHETHREDLFEGVPDHVLCPVVAIPGLTDGADV